jgi:hypothetical protein
MSGVDDSSGCQCVVKAWKILAKAQGWGELEMEKLLVLVTVLFLRGLAASSLMDQ